MFEEKEVKEYVSMLKKGASLEELNSTFYIRSMAEIARKYYVFQYSNITLQKLESFLIWQNIPKDDIVLTSKSLSIKLDKISVRMYPYWGGVILLNFIAPCYTKSYLEIKCSVEKAYDFLKEANDASSGILKRFDYLKQEMEKMMKKTIAEVIFAREKKDKARSVSITSIETVVKQKLMSYGIEKLSFDHKKIVSHIFATFKDGKQQIDIAVKHNDLQKAIETIDNAVRVIELIQKSDFVVRGKLGFGYDS
ncbi:MAG: hypothetical protein J6S84_06855 [Bacteroidales bacterium]|nr:hypothetical protein [Bacteroidales bacterium]